MKTIDLGKMLILVMLIAMFPFEGWAQSENQIKPLTFAKKEKNATVPMPVRKKITYRYQSGELFTSGPIINSLGTGIGGADESIAYSPLMLLAWPCSSPVRLTDDFTVTSENWSIDSLAFYGITVGEAPSQSNFSGTNVRIWDGFPGAAGSHVVWGSEFNNVMIRADFASVYRRGYNQTPEEGYPVYRIVCATNDLSLPAGNYWVDWQIEVISNCISYSPPVVADGPTSGNAYEYRELTDQWNEIESEGFHQGMPFVMYGEAQNQPNDLRLSEVISPVNGSNLGENENVSVRIVNLGSTDVSNIPVHYQLDGGNVVNETVFATIPAGDTLIYPFNQKANLSEFGIHYIESWVSYPQDPFAGNNRCTTKVYHYMNEVSMINSTATTQCAAFYDSGGPDGTYSPNETYTYTFYPASNDPHAKVRVKFVDINMEEGWDILEVYDGSDAVNYPKITFLTGGFVAPGYQEIVSSATSGALTFRFLSDGYNSYDGWFAIIDLYIPQNNDLAATNLEGNLFPTANVLYPYKVKIKNTGNQTQTNFQVKLVTGQGTVVGSVSGSQILPGEEKEFSLQGTFTSSGETPLHAKVELSGDQDSTNNATAAIYPVVQLPGQLVVPQGKKDNRDKSFPVSMIFRNSLSEILYYNSEINISGLISKISLRYNFREDVYSTPLKIWMGETDLNDLSQAWIPSSQLTPVFDSVVDYTKGIHYLEIPLSTLYQYTGKNLVIMINRPLDYNLYYGDEYGRNTFYYTSTPEHPSRSRTKATDLVVINPDNPRNCNIQDWVPYTLLTFDVAGTGSLKGTVCDNNGQPMKDVTVAIGDLHQTATSCSDGSYAFATVMPGTYPAMATKYAYLDSTMNVAVVANQSTVNNFVLRDRPLGTVSGMVKPDNNSAVAIAGAIVKLKGYNSEYTDTTDANGNFQFANIYGNTSYKVTVMSPEYQPWESDIMPSGGTYDMGTILLFELTNKPQYVIAEPAGNDMNVHWSAEISYTTISYDDGIPDNAKATFVAGAESALRFCPESYPLTLKKALIHIFDGSYPPGNTLQPFQVAVYDDDGTNGFPGTCLGAIDYTPVAHNWVEIDLSALNITFYDGDFYISYRQGGVYPNATPIAVDYSNPVNRSYYRGQVGWLWNQEASGSSNINYMIRAVVSTANDSKKELAGKGQNNSREQEGYNVYRLISGKENLPETWILLSENQPDTLFIDNQWNILGWGNYRYAVKSVYAHSLLSGATFSDPVLRDMETGATINISTNAGYVPYNALASLTRVDGDSSISYSQYSANNTAIAFNPVWKGHYLFKITHRNFEDYTDTVFIQNNDAINVLLTEKARESYFVNATADNYTAALSWYNPTDIECMRYDDNIAEYVLGCPVGFNCWHGNQFLTGFSGKIVAVDIYFERDPDASDEELTVDIFDANRNIIGSSQPFYAVADSWVRVMLPEVAFYGSFYAMVHYNYLNNDQHYMCLDANGSNAALNLGWIYDGAQWTRFSDWIGVNPCVFIMKAYTRMNEPETRSIQNYNVYRLLSGEENNPSNWTSVAENLNDTTCADRGWEFLDPLQYRYAVTATYTSGVTSGGAFSNVLMRNNYINNQALIYTFGIPGQVQPTSIDETNHTVDVIMPQGTNLTSLVPEFLLSDDAWATVNGVQQVSGTTSNNFIQPVVYTVHAEDGIHTINWTITVTITTSINENEVHFSLYPNPASGKVTIRSANYMDKLELLDTKGSIIRQIQNAGKDYILNVEGIPSGIYLVKVISENGVNTLKLSVK